MIGAEVLKEFPSLRTDEEISYDELLKKLEHYICPVCVMICECLRCKRQKLSLHNRNQKWLKSLDKHDRVEPPYSGKLPRLPNQGSGSKSKSKVLTPTSAEKPKKREVKSAAKPEPVNGSRINAHKYVSLRVSPYTGGPSEEPVDKINHAQIANSLKKQLRDKLAAARQNNA